MSNLRELGNAGVPGAGGANPTTSAPKGQVESSYAKDKMDNGTPHPAASHPQAIELREPADLPRELWEQVFAKLSYEDLSNASYACKEFAAMAKTSLPQKKLEYLIGQAGDPDTVIKILAEASERRILQNTASLDLSRKQLTAEHMKKLCEILQKACSANLIHLNLEKNAFEGEGVVSLAATRLAALKTLNLRLNSLGDSDISGLAALAKADLPALETLDLGINQIWGSNDAERAAFAAFVTWARDRTVLKDLSLACNDIDDACTKLLAEGLADLKHLDLWGNNVGDVGAKALADSLTAPERLVLHGNDIGDEGARALIATTKESLRCLDLTNNLIWKPDNLLKDAFCSKELTVLASGQRTKYLRR